ncbi:hypothetical protein EJB05_57631 [Eragrostis curvula]|uniref:BOS complex subunit TMEM147 n=1 Tax=Eragrostis curvula TaxID=38414 RepID=A0A5J9SEB7_9POAL|nr:hypothetical protein EJB05_57631 [Eragrostis curvula]
MTVFHFLNCAVLTFGPHVVYYSATPLSEYDTIGTSVKAAVVYLGTALVKLVCLATLLKVPENDSFDPYQELMKIFIGFIDVAGLYFALTQLTHRNISQNHKFQAVGLGWAFADSVLHRLAPLWIGARGLEFTWEYIFQGLEANANLVMTLSLAALGSLMWLRKNKPKTLIPIIYACALLLATMPFITRSLSFSLPIGCFIFVICKDFMLLSANVTVLLEEIIGVADSQGGWVRAVLLTSYGFHQLAAVFSLSEADVMCEAKHRHLPPKWFDGPKDPSCCTPEELGFSFEPLR